MSQDQAQAPAPPAPSGITVPADDIWTAHMPKDPTARRTWRNDRPPPPTAPVGKLMFLASVLAVVVGVLVVEPHPLVVIGGVVGVAWLLRRR